MTVVNIFMMPERKRVASHPHTEKKVSAIKESTEAKPNFSVLGLEKAERGYNPSKEWAEANGGSAGLVRAGVERFSKEFSTKKLRSFLFGFGKNLSALTMEGGKDFIREEVAKKHFTAEQQADFEKTVNEVIEKASERLGKSAERIDKIKEELDRQEIEKLGVQLYRRLKCLKAILDDCEGTAQEVLSEQVVNLLAEVEELTERPEPKMVLKELQRMGVEKIAPLEKDTSVEIKKELIHSIDELGKKLDETYQQLLTKRDYIEQYGLSKAALGLDSFLYSPNPQSAIRDFIGEERKKIEVGGPDLDFGPSHYSGPIQLTLQLRDWVRTFQKMLNTVIEHQQSHPPAKPGFLSRIFNRPKT
ncbi:MAG: hypothetical protein A3D53_01010 [Candidatus Magasanikbacteria bacterium RIFCSPHIGHO2_02_FULL_45_10]|uniref:Uncharacterized protein n=2 Tax=Candidatus Magasanikiibacteriota TaxID=1752731 RepID=A0A1F6MCD9_9BACT|nr:MAG: hypothetical protein A3D53_01010 [Candidatus Magasanikbacteria bacterium RIFCSPHIGHO2_02_FULL_45_10]